MKLEKVLTRFINLEHRLARYAMKSSAYSFSQDYVSTRSTVWTRYLSDLREKEDVHLLEVGSFEGRSAIWFLENIFTHPSSTVTCVDMFCRMAEIRFDHNIAVSGLSNRVTKIGGRSQEILKLLREDSYDVIYIDGSHRAADVQLDAWLSWQLLKRDGVIIFDDYLWEMEKPEEDRPQVAIDNFLRHFGPQIEILHKDYQVIIRRVSLAEMRAEPDSRRIDSRC